ncbi:transposase [Synechococcus sp. W70.1]
MPPEYTTQECSGCGYLVKKTLKCYAPLTRPTRTHRCPRCGLVLDRDVNAAIKVLRTANAIVLRRGLAVV